MRIEASFAYILSCPGQLVSRWTAARLTSSVISGVGIVSLKHVPAGSLTSNAIAVPNPPAKLSATRGQVCFPAQALGSYNLMLLA